MSKMDTVDASTQEFEGKVKTIKEILITKLKRLKKD